MACTVNFCVSKSIKTWSIKTKLEVPNAGKHFNSKCQVNSQIQTPVKYFPKLFHFQCKHQNKGHPKVVPIRLLEIKARNESCLGKVLHYINGCNLHIPCPKSKLCLRLFVTNVHAPSVAPTKQQLAQKLKQLWSATSCMHNFTMLIVSFVTFLKLQVLQLCQCPSPLHKQCHTRSSPCRPIYPQANKETIDHADMKVNPRQLHWWWVQLSLLPHTSLVFLWILHWKHGKSQTTF